MFKLVLGMNCLVQIPVRIQWQEVNKKVKFDSGCGSVSRVVASDTRGPRFEYSYFLKNNYSLSTVYCKDKNKKKVTGNVVCDSKVYFLLTLEWI